MTYSKNKKIKVYIFILLIILILSHISQIILNTQNIIQFSPKNGFFSKIAVFSWKNEESTKKNSNFPQKMSKNAYLHEERTYYINENQSRIISSYHAVVAIGGKIEKRLIACYKTLIDFFKVSVKNLVFLMKRATDGLKEFFLKKLERELVPRDASLVTGLLFGDTSSISQDIYHSFKVIGILHVLSASASNLNAFLLFFSFPLLLFRRWIPRSLKILLSFCLVVAYVFLVWEAVSIWRAGIMTILALFAAEVFFFSCSRRILLLQTAIIIGLINPFSLTTLSFQLSFFATLGLISFANLLTDQFILKKSKINKVKNYLISSLISSFSAQVLIFPLMIQSFSELNLVSFFSNLLLLPLFDFLLVLSFAALLSFSFFEQSSISLFLSLLIHKSINIVIFMAEWILKNFPFSFQLNDKKDVISSLFAALSVMMFFLSFLLKSKHRKKIRYRILC